MFILREFSEVHPVYNKSLGEDYSVIYKSNNAKDFNSACLLFWEKIDFIPDECFALIIFNHGANIYPLYKGVKYYIMTDTGATFDNLTFK